MEKISIIHIYIYGRLKRKVGGGNIIHIGQILPIIKWCIRMPHKYTRNILKELCVVGLVKKLSRDNYELLRTNKKPMTDSLGDALW